MYVWMYVWMDVLYALHGMCGSVLYAYDTDLSRLT